MAKNQVSADNYFAIVPEWVIYSDISANALRLYCVLARHADKNTGGCFPSRNTLMGLVRLSKATLSVATGELVAIGALTVTKRFGDGNSFMSNLYKIITTNPHPSSEIEQGGSAEIEQGLFNNQTSPSAESDPLTRVIINQSHLTKEVLKAYEAFLEVYPRVVDPNGTTQRAFLKALKKEPQSSVIFLGAMRYRDDPNRDPEFTAMSATWLNQERWLLPALPGRSKPKGQTFLETFRQERSTPERLALN